MIAGDMKRRSAMLSKPLAELSAGSGSGESTAFGGGSRWSIRRYITHMRAGLIPLTLLAASTAASAGTRLIDAVKRGDAAAVRTLITQKVDVNAPDTDGSTALHWAVQRDDVAMAD